AGSRTDPQSSPRRPPGRIIMSTRVTLTAADGLLGGREFVFEDNKLCTIGRSHDCDLCLSTDVPDLTISRRHCLLEIDSPEVRIHDLGSRNGTYVNGEKVGQRREGARPRDIPVSTPPRTLHDGDMLQIGTSFFHVAIDSDDEGGHDPAEKHGALCC